MPLVFPLPPVSTSGAHIISAFFAVSYVCSLYISKNARLSFNSRSSHAHDGRARRKIGDERWRDDPDVIKARLLAVCSSTVLSCVSVFWLVWHIVGDDEGSFRIALDTTAARLGLTIFNDHSFYPHLVTPILFLGPLYATYLYGKLPFQSQWSLRGNVFPVFCTWPGVRNYIFGPLTEELVFRACMLAVYHLAGSSANKMILLSPLSFGLAHVHHAWDIYNRYGGTRAALRRAVLVSLFQFGYTTLFGFHCAFLFLRTGSIYPALTSHIFCNFMGLPDLGNEIYEFSHRKWSLIAMYVVGVVGYIYTLSNWTLAEESLYWPQTSQRY